MGTEMPRARWKASVAWFAGTLLTVGAATACGGGGSKLGSREAVSRELPTTTALDPWEPDVTLDAGLVDDLFAGYEGGPCCDVAFALPAQDGEVSAVLRGSDAPLDGMGVSLSQDGGVWRATVCMPADYPGFYYYEVFSESEVDAGSSEDKPLFAARRINPSAPEGTDSVVGTVNAFSPLDDCSDSSADVHSELP